jgi:hypothetical protein
MSLILLHCFHARLHFRSADLSSKGSAGMRPMKNLTFTADAMALGTSSIVFRVLFVSTETNCRLCTFARCRSRGWGTRNPWVPTIKRNIGGLDVSKTSPHFVLAASQGYESRTSEFEVESSYFASRSSRSMSWDCSPYVKDHRGTQCPLNADMMSFLFSYCLCYFVLSSHH